MNKTMGQQAVLNSDYKALISKLDDLIRNGQQGEARALLLELSPHKIPRSHAVSIADLARRLNMPRLIILTLKHIVRSEQPISPPPSDREWALYATGLSRLGVFTEAQKILDSLRHSDSPEVLLFQSQHFMLQWDLESAILKLKKYIDQGQISQYERLVGLVNLAACYTWEKQSQAGEEIISRIWDEVAKQGHEEGHKLIYGYSIELAAEIAIQEKQFEKAEALIAKASSLLSGSKSRYEFYVKKWKSILGLLKAPDSESRLKELHWVKGEAQKLAEWEVVRDCEFYEALARRDDALFIRVYNGTSLPSFRKRIKKIYKPDFAIPRDFVWRFGESSSPSRIFDISKGCEEGGQKALSPYPLLFNLLRVLTEDFYRPAPLGTLIDHLYPDEFFNPHSTPQKTYQIISRLRQWFKDESIPLDIVVDDKDYQLVALDTYSIRVVRSQSAVSKNAALVERLKVQFGGNAFTSNDVASALSLAPRSAQRFLSWALENKKVSKLASGRSARYRLK